MRAKASARAATIISMASGEIFGGALGGRRQINSNGSLATRNLGGRVALKAAVADRWRI